jgi:hypothetical protein
MRSTMRAIDIQETYWTLHAKLILHPFAVSSDERNLLETIVLQRFYDQLADELDWNNGSRATLGSMIQQQLTILLYNLDASQHGTLFSLTSLRGSLTDGNQLGKAVAGAQACVSAIKSIHRCREEARFFLSTIEEDVHLGIDFFWIEEDIRAAVSVKWNSGVEGIKAYLASRNIGKRDELKRELQRIREGTTELNRQHNTSWLPILIHANRPPTTMERIEPIDHNGWCATLCKKILIRSQQVA